VPAFARGKAAGERVPRYQVALTEDEARKLRVVAALFDTTVMNYVSTAIIKSIDDHMKLHHDGVEFSTLKRIV
jgi:hypothetical protein